MIEAKQTLALSAKTAASFVRNLGALNPFLLQPFPAATLGKRPGIHTTVIDHRHWFAKLYELVTYREVPYSSHTNYPGYSLHFIFNSQYSPEPILDPSSDGFSHISAIVLIPTANPEVPQNSRLFLPPINRYPLLLSPLGGQ